MQINITMFQQAFFKKKNNKKKNMKCLPVYSLFILDTRTASKICDYSDAES